MVRNLRLLLALMAALGGVALGSKCVQAQIPGVIPEMRTLQQFSDPGPPITPKLLRFAQRLMDSTDGPGTRQWTELQWQQIHPRLSAADFNRDGVITDYELAQHIARYGQRRGLRSVAAVAGMDQQGGEEDQGPASDEEATAEQGETNGGSLPPRENGGAMDESAREDAHRRPFVPPAHRFPAGLPSWFVERDLNGDGQLTLHEFSPTPTLQDIQEFQSYDLNGDGVLTPDEVMRAMREQRRQRY